MDSTLLLYASFLAETAALEASGPARRRRGGAVCSGDARASHTGVTAWHRNSSSRREQKRRTSGLILQASCNSAATFVLASQLGMW
ncbi:hypothetical protein GUJ93_ZPchr0002g26082 [Zizania palustris]|uniref:Secreted protein n=1 Tax=Zizania palustris TaxID=103762 RepID=A0A8J5VV80_ZIZPA|nr:hypothetical protein GUJ93_ZPchr0002g26082 [Zizania palustris]